MDILPMRSKKKSKLESTLVEENKRLRWKIKEMEGTFEKQSDAYVAKTRKKIE